MRRSVLSAGMRRSERMPPSVMVSVSDKSSSVSVLLPSSARSPACVTRVKLRAAAERRNQRGKQSESGAFLVPDPSRAQPGVRGPTIGGRLVT